MLEAFRVLRNWMLDDNVSEISMATCYVLFKRLEKFTII